MYSIAFCRLAIDIIELVKSNQGMDCFEYISSLPSASHRLDGNFLMIAYATIFIHSLLTL